MCDLNRKAGGLILRIYIHRLITEKSDVKATIHSYSRMNMTTLWCVYMCVCVCIYIYIYIYIYIANEERVGNVKRHSQESCYS